MSSVLPNGHLEEILSTFELPVHKDVEVKKFGNGHIHKTYSLYIGSEGFVLQQVNTVAFNSPKKLMENITAVCEYLKKKIIESGGDATRETRNVVYTHDGRSYHTTSDGAVYRIFTMVEDVVCYEAVDNTELFHRCGEAFGLFQKQLADFPASTLHDTIENFHNTPIRFENFEKAVEQDPLGRVAGAKREIEFIKQRKDICGYITERLADGRIPLKVTHNDTKLNNVLFDAKTDEAVCIIDLDTIMPGSLLYDFGDSIRFGASSAAEDETDLDKVYLRTDFYKAYLDGFLSQLNDTITDEEIKGLYYGALLMTFEVGMRFLTDYILGDVYFHTAYPEHNLHRSRTQLKLIEEMENKKEELLKFVENR